MSFEWSDMTLGLMGGSLIGLASAGILLVYGRIAGVSGIVSGLLTYQKGDMTWRFAFVAGLMGGAALLLAYDPTLFSFPAADHPLALILAGALVGVGTQMGSGCTSGHGVCGLPRLSKRSWAAVLTFVSSGIVMASLLRPFLGGLL
jgi:uncharacterized membrane protein YedE/YeeE